MILRRNEGAIPAASNVLCERNAWVEGSVNGQTAQSRQTNLPVHSHELRAR